MSAIISRMVSISRPTSKKEATDLIRRARAEGLSVPAGTLADLTKLVIAADAEMQAKRTARQNARWMPRTKTLAERLKSHIAAKDAKIIALVRECRRGLYKVARDVGKYAFGKSGHTTTIKIGDMPSVRGDSERVYGKKWSATASHHCYTVRRDWVAIVYDRDLEVLDGMFTLAAEPIQGHGPELFRATWVEQGRGCSLNQVSGYIARIDTTTYHAKTARAALDGVQRKAGLKPARRQGVIDLDRLVRRHGDLPVYWQDARDCQLCAPGIRNWCNAVDVSDRETTIAEVVAGYKLRPLPEVIQVIRRVVRDRHNRAPLDLSAPSSGLESQGRVVFDCEGGFRVENN